MKRDRPISRPDIAAIDLAPRAPRILVGDEIESAETDGRTHKFLAFCKDLPSNGGLPARAAASPETLRPWIGNLMILDPVDGGRDFRYRLYGSAIVSHCDFDLTGRLVSSFSSKTGTFFLESYRTCLSTLKPVLTQNVAEHSRGMILWERLLVPFRTDRGSVQIVATNHPIPLVAKASPTRRSHGYDPRPAGIR
ncbi:MAG: hypothetical protein JNM30_14115 [Rhodospirillales bacterium]|nr:hypothetical protein [Rhodospirillales bacterium]